MVPLLSFLSWGEKITLFSNYILCLLTLCSANISFRSLQRQSAQMKKQNPRVSFSKVNKNIQQRNHRNAREISQSGKKQANIWENRNYF